MTDDRIHASGLWRRFLDFGVESPATVACTPGSGDKAMASNAHLRNAWTRWDSQLPPIPADAMVYKLFSEEHLPQSSYG